jgi:general secretion pathway protein H
VTTVRRRPHHRAFTLIEMIVVLMVLAVAMAVTAPSLRGWSQGAKLRDAGQQFLAATSYARSQAAAVATPHRVAIDPAANAYAVEWLNGQTWEPVAGEWGFANALPANHRIEWLGADAASNAVIFFPNGRTTPGTVRLTAQGGETIDLTCAVPAEPFVRIEATP